MLIRFKENISTSHASYLAGKDYDLPNDEANHYVQSGIANKSPEPLDVHATSATRATDPASVRAVAAFENKGKPGKPARVPLSSGNPGPHETTAVPVDADGESDVQARVAAATTAGAKTIQAPPLATPIVGSATMDSNAMPSQVNPQPEVKQ